MPQTLSPYRVGGHRKLSCAVIGHFPDAAGVTTEAIRVGDRNGLLPGAARGAADDDDAVAVGALMADLYDLPLRPHAAE